MRTKSGPNKQTETSLERWSCYAFKQTLEQFVCDENAIRDRTDLTAKSTVNLWTKPAAIVSCAVHYETRKCLLTVSLSNISTMAGRGHTWSCDEVGSI